MLSNLILTKSIFPESNLVFSIGVVLNSFLLFYAPVLYLFALSIINGSVSVKKHLIHFYPFIIFSFLNVVVALMLYFNIKNELFSTILYVRNSLDKLYFLQVIGYTCISFWAVHKFRSKNLKIHKISRWFKQILILFLIIWLLFLANSLTESSPKVSLIFKVSGLLGLVLLSNFTLFLLLNSPDFFYNNLSVKLKKQVNPKISKETYEKLCNLVTTNKLYKKTDLKIVDLSDALGESSRTISILINTFYEGNFYDFINSYRIEEAKLLLTNSDEEMTILAILYESGFNSKSVFNAVFKKVVGETPSSYRKQHKHSLHR